MSRNWGCRVWAYPLVLTAGLAGVLYFAVGCYLLFHGWGKDVHSRWAEMQYVLRGTDPFAVLRGEVPADPSIGLPPWGGYTPWSYILGLGLVPPVSFNIARVYYAVVTAIAWLVAAGLAYRAGRGGCPQQPRVGGLVLAACSLGLYPVVNCVRWGNYGLIVLGFLAGMAWFVERRNPFGAGICFAMAMVKPHLAILFGLVLLVRRAWGAIAIASLAVLAACGLASVITHTPPWVLLGEMTEQASMMGSYYGVFDELIRRGFGRQGLLALSMAVGIGATAFVLYRARHKSIWVLMAVPAVVSTMWSYQQYHDSVVLYFLILATGLTAFRRPSRETVVAFGLGVLTLMQPTQAANGSAFFHVLPWEVPVAFRLLWIAALAVALIRAPPEDEMHVATSIARPLTAPR